jgi:hypothetical protein
VLDWEVLVRAHHGRATSTSWACPQCGKVPTGGRTTVNRRELLHMGCKPKWICQTWLRAAVCRTPRSAAGSRGRHCHNTTSRGSRGRSAAAPARRALSCALDPGTLTVCVDPQPGSPLPRYQRASPIPPRSRILLHPLVQCRCVQIVLERSTPKVDVAPDSA